jgi:Spinocerebellar ataxia type 10 protein domain
MDDGDGPSSMSLFPVASKMNSIPNPSETSAARNEDIVQMKDALSPSKSTQNIVPTSHASGLGHDDQQVLKKDGLVSEARALVQHMVDVMDTDTSAGPEQSPIFSRNCLKAFALSPDFTTEKFVNSGGLRSLAMAIKRYSNNSEVLDYGCKAFAALTLYDSHLNNEVAKSGGIDAIIYALNLQINHKHETATVSALKMLRNLTQSEENRRAICKQAGTEAIVKSMTSRLEDARCCSHAALVLSNLAFGNQEAKESVGSLGGISAISKAMKLHGDVKMMQARGALALRNLCYNSEKNQAIAGENNGTEVLLAAIENFLDDREVAHQSCVALANMSSINPENRGRIVKSRGVKTILKLMNKYPESTTVLDDGVTILRNVSAGSDLAQAEIGREGGIAIIVQGMRKNQSDSRIVGKATAALRYLCFLDENRRRVAASGGIEAITEALKSSKFSAVAVENSLLAIGNSTFESPQNKAIVGRCGGIQAIVQALSEHLGNETIQEHGCRVLRNLADGFEFNRRLEIEYGAVNTGVFALMGYPESAAVQEQGLAMLLNLSMSETSLEKLRAADVPRLAEKALNMHANHRGVALKGGRLLERVGGPDESASPKVASRSESGTKFGIRPFARKK